MTNFKSWENNSSLFEVKRAVITSKYSKALDIRNYIRADRFYTRSDIRLKNNVEELNDNHLDRLDRLVPKSYGFKNDGLEHFGFIAQEVEKDFPNLVSMDDDGMKSVNYLEMIPLLLHKINYLERKLNEIKK
jgi:hypothetical protein